MSLLLLIGILVAFPAAEVVLDVPEPLVPGVTASGTITVKDPPSAVAKIELPKMAGLEWGEIGRSGNRTTIVNGVQSSEQTFSVVLRAPQVGVLTIPPVKIRLRDGSVLASQPRTLRVEPGDTKLTGEAQAEVSFQPARIVPGESTNLVYRIHVRRGFDVKTLGIAPPDGTISLGERNIAQGRTVDAQGQEWSVITTTWPLTHATPGSYTVRGQQEYLAQVSDGFFAQWERRQLAVAPAVLTVEALPAEGRPADFTGLIGPVTAQTGLDRERVAAGEGAVVKIAITSRQTDLAKRPHLNIPGVQLYDKDDTTKDGVRTFRWDVVPAVPGNVVIPAVHIPYFDPGSRSYRTADTQPATLAVIPGRSRDLGIVGAAPTTGASTPAPVAAPTMPAPIHGAASPRPASSLAPTVFVAGLIVGLAAALVSRLPRRAGPHRGRALARAGRDPAKLAVALATLRPALTDPAHLAAATALEAAIDRTRFGGEALPDLAPWISALEGVP